MNKEKFISALAAIAITAAVTLGFAMLSAEVTEVCGDGISARR